MRSRSIIFLSDRVSQISRVLPLVLQSQLLQQRDTDLHYDFLRHVGRWGSAENFVGQKSGIRSKDELIFHRKISVLSEFQRNYIKYLFKKYLVCALCYRCWATLTTSSLLFSRSKSASKWSHMASSSTRARFADRLLICSIFSSFALLSFPWQPGIIILF